MSESATDMIRRHEKIWIGFYSDNERYWLKLASRSVLQAKICFALFIAFALNIVLYTPMLLPAFFSLLGVAEGMESYRRRKRFAQEYTDKVIACHDRIAKLDAITVQ